MINKTTNDDVRNNGEREYENVMLLTMSTLNKVPHVSYYKGDYIDKTTVYFEGISQLEADTKYVLRMLKKDGEKIDRMIVVCTPETVKLPKEKDKNGQYSGAYNINIQKNEGEEKKVLYGKESPMSAFVFFNKRINDFIKGNEEEWSCSPNSYGPIDNGNLGYDVPPIECVELGKNKEIFDIVPKLCEKICGKNSMEKINLFVDMQGGRRSYVSVISDVLSLLKMRGLTNVRYFANDFEYGQEIHPIREVTKENLVADLIAAFDVFRDSGRADDLKLYYEKYKNVAGIGEAEEEVIGAIGELSDAIMLCAVNRMMRAVKILKKKIESYEDKNSNKDPLFEELIQDIKKDYEGIFSSDADLFQTIRWCLKKKMYQQAITLLESKFPEKLFADHVLGIYLPLNEAENRTKIEINEYYNDDKIKEEASKGRNWSFAYPYYDVVSFLSNKIYYKKNQDFFRKTPIQGDGYGVKCKFLPKSDRPSKRVDGILILNIPMETFKNVLYKYAEIKQLRNNTNHANSDQITTVTVKEQLTRFMKEYEGIK